MPYCLFCPTELQGNDKPEHILLNGLGGRKTTKWADCSRCNNKFGSTIDEALTAQVKVIRNLLQLESGNGKPPPMLRNIRVGQETYNLRGDGSPELVGKPFIVNKRDDGSCEALITVRSQEELARMIPHIAAQVDCSENNVLRSLQQARATFVAKRPSMMPFSLSLGGPEALRSIAKACLVLWSTVAGNEDVRSASYVEARRFVSDGDDDFNKRRIQLDARYLPCVEMLKTQYGHLFNLIYVRSDDEGRVIGHFTLYNAVSWQMVLAENGGIPSRAVALVSNPLNPADWSDTIADQLNIDFDWLDRPSFDDGLRTAQERFSALVKHHFDEGMPRELGKIVNDVCGRYGILDDTPIPEAMWSKILSEISERSAYLIAGVPYEKALTPTEIADFLEGVGSAT